MIYLNMRKKYNQIALFADDTSLVKAGKRKEYQIQEEIKKMAVWFTSNRLTVNASKCEVMNFGLGGQHCITLMNQKNPQKSSSKYLGLHIDGKLTLRDHINYVVKKLNRFSGLVYNVRHPYPSKCLLLLCNSYAESVIRYGLLIYGSAAKTNLEKIERAQRRIWRAFFFRGKLIVSRKQLRNTNFSLFSNCMY